MSRKLHIVFVCTGNICRSPMGEIILKKAVADAGLESDVRITSCGTGGWHIGDGADYRAVNELARAGYDGSKHRAAQLGDDHREADLLIALDQGHYRALMSAGYDKNRVRLLRSFDPDAGDDLDVADPYYGTEKDFTTTRTQIEAAVDGMMEWINEQLGH